MNTMRKYYSGGVGIVLFSLFLLAYFIPQYVDTPGAVRNIALSPSFWPTIIAWMMLAIGVGVLVSRYMERKHIEEESEETSEEAISASQYFRLLLIFALFFGYYLLMPVLGMIWSSSLAFVIFAIFLSRTEYRKTAILVGLLLPVMLYAFFYHVAGVNIPQSDFMRLP